MGEIGKRGRRTIDIDRPDRSIVTIVSAEALAIVRKPRVDNIVLGAGKEEVPFFVELNLG